MTKKARMLEPSSRAPRREFTEEFRREAVQMMLDGHTAASVAERLGGHEPALPLEAGASRT